MRIHNVRLGHACNSSSTHSILIFPKDAPLPANDPYNGWGFGWEDFTLTSAEDKAAYTWIQFANATTPDMADLILMGAGVKKPEDLVSTDLDDYDIYVDHQSQLTLPHEWDGKNISVQYAIDLARFMNQKNAVILGGNDNSDGHPLVQSLFRDPNDPFSDSRGSREIVWQFEDSPHKDRSVLHRTPDGGLWSPTDDLGGNTWRSGTIVARKDGALWTLFSRDSGDRVSISFDDSPLPTKLDSPMLVDIKLTDYCAMGCPFCYQGSTEEGLHADKDYVEGLIYTLSRMKVFEIAFGGGEPTEHPNFAEFVKSAREHNITPNVTSRNPAWFMAKKNKEAVKALGAIAFSAETLSQLKKWEPFIKARDYFDPEMTVQVIDGAIKATELAKIAKYAFDNRMRITVLGWKTTGRADQFNLRDQGKWLDWFKGLEPHERNRVAVDTVIVQQYKEQFEEMGVAPESYIDQEGRWSCYIDAVQKIMAPSSYGVLSDARTLASAYDVDDVFPTLPVH
jgi:organic radical activating enzyme